MKRYNAKMFKVKGKLVINTSFNYVPGGVLLCSKLERACDLNQTWGQHK